MENATGTLKDLAYYPIGHARTPGQRQRMIDILQPVRWAGAMDGVPKR